MEERGLTRRDAEKTCAVVATKDREAGGTTRGASDGTVGAPVLEGRESLLQPPRMAAVDPHRGA